MRELTLPALLLLATACSGTADKADTTLPTPADDTTPTGDADTDADTDTDITPSGVPDGSGT